MATLNLGNYSDLKGNSVIGYKQDDESYVVEKELTSEEIKAGYKTVATVTGSGKSFSLDVTSTSATEFMDTGDRNWTISVQGGQNVQLGSGKDDVTVKSMTTDQTISTGDGSDTVTVVNATAGTVNLGEGNDKLIAQGGTFSVTGGAGKDTIDVSGFTSGVVTLNDFDATEDTLVTNGTIAGNINASGVISVSGSGQVQVNETNGYYIVNTKADGIVAWAGADGSNVDLSSYTKDLVIDGTINDVTDTLIGGSKNDSIFAGNGDYVYGGAGKDTIDLTAATEAAYVGLAAAGGKDNVSGFSTGTDGDVVLLFENNIGEGVTLSHSGSDIVVKQGAATLTLDNKYSTGGTVINIQDNTGTKYDVNFVNGTASVSAADSMNKVYYSDSASKTNKLDFSKFDESLVVDLGNTGNFANTGDASYYGNFASVTGGSDTTVLVGKADNKETLVAGAGATTLWGGGKSADMLVGNSSTDNAVTYYYATGDGKDTIKSGTWNGSDAGDVLWFGNVQLASIKKSGSEITFSMADSADKLTVTGVSNDDAILKYTNDGTEIKKAKIATTGKAASWTYADDVNMYIGGKSNTLTVTEDANIWLDGRTGVSYDNVSKVSAASSSGTVVIAGKGDTSEVLEAGKGESSLWGGAGTSNDTLKGSGTGTTLYYFGKGEGNDVITGTGSDDKVILYNVAGSDIASIDTSKSGQMKFTLNDGATLTITGMNSTSSVSQFQLSDGSNWSYDYSTKGWTKK